MEFLFHAGGIVSQSSWMVFSHVEFLVIWHSIENTINKVSVTVPHVKVTYFTFAGGDCGVQKIMFQHFSEKGGGGGGGALIWVCALSQRNTV